MTKLLTLKALLDRSRIFVLIPLDDTVTNVCDLIHFTEVRAGLESDYKHRIFMLNLRR